MGQSIFASRKTEDTFFSRSTQPDNFYISNILPASRLRQRWPPGLQQGEHVEVYRVFSTGDFGEVSSNLQRYHCAQSPRERTQMASKKLVVA